MGPGWGVSALGEGKLCCLLLPSSLLQTPQTDCKANIENRATRGWAGTVAFAMRQTHSSHRAWRQTPTRSWSSASACPAAVSEARRCLQTLSHCPCATAQLFQGDGELIRSLHCLPQTLSLLSSFSVDVPSVVFWLLTGLIGRPSRGNKMFQLSGCFFCPCLLLRLWEGASS